LSRPRYWGEGQLFHEQQPEGYEWHPTEPKPTVAVAGQFSDPGATSSEPESGKEDREKESEKKSRKDSS